MLWRALVAFLVLPGVVAFAVPLTLALAKPHSPYTQATGLVPVVAGTWLLLRCVSEFYVAGLGTLAPWAPPEFLVTTGPYRFSRNPMYIGVALLLLGWAIFFHSTALIIYAGIVVIAFQLRVVLAEEPWAARRFGAAWDDYRSRVPRWLI